MAKPEAARHRPKDLHPHQQHQPDPSDGQPGAPPRRGGRLRGGVSTAWRCGCELSRHRRAARAARSSRPRSAASATARYHNRHPFHRLLHGGRLTQGQVQAWALNRYYYQSRIPMKDCALMARIADPDLRQEWAQRVLDHDGGARRAGRHRALAEALRRRRARRGMREARGGHPAGDALRGRRLCPLRLGEVAARGDRLLAHRALRAGHHPRARLRHARRLRLRRRGGARLFPPAARPGAARCRFRARLREGARDARRSCAEKSARRCSSSAMCCGRSSMRCTTPMCSPAAFRPAASCRRGSRAVEAVA